MPEKIKFALEQMDSSEADAAYLWLDGNPDCVHEMLRILADKLPNGALVE